MVAARGWARGAAFALLIAASAAWSGAAHAKTGSAKKAAPPAPADTASYQRLVGFADHLCHLGGDLNPEKLLRGLFTAGISASVKPGAGDLRALPPPDAKGAPASSDTCARTVFTKLLDAFYLTDLTSGQPIARPAHTASAYRTARAGLSAGQGASAAAGPPPPAKPSGNDELAGGAVQGNPIYKPPQDQQAEQDARAALKSELTELANTPDKLPPPPPLTLMESQSSTPAPHQLYLVVRKYYKPTLVSARDGNNLYNYEASYYKLQTEELQFENNTVVKISSIVPAKGMGGWELCFRYFFLRSDGFSTAEIQADANFLAFDVSWDDAENVYQALAKDPAAGPVMLDKIRQLSVIQGQAAGILRAYKGQ